MVKRKTTRTTRPAQRDPEEMIRDGLQLMKAVYYREVGEFAQGLIDDSEKDIDREDFLTRITESVDDHQWVIYTGKAQIVVLVSDNEAAAFEEGLADPSSWKDGINWSQLAYAALERDVIEEMERRGVEINDDKPLAHAKRSRRRSR